MGWGNAPKKSVFFRISNLHIQGLVEFSFTSNCDGGLHPNIGQEIF